ncbi:hypothetical protein SK224_08255 [Microbacterium sp. BG28]|uniref:hypothetical protein n=1 Tax=Microbacterium sp. BG28 TaxID=3097356 RepID=UPI002A5A61AE|nr:hypothetical protein [Microbacterium sp. BG28]MDY0829119.1 hypothetical protein [Microbacterium sp. BG28]
MSSKHLTPEEVAAATLKAHAIQPHWNRTGDQVAGLIAEAVRMDRDAHGISEGRNLAAEYAERVGKGIYAQHEAGASYGYVNEMTGSTAETLEEIDGYDAEEHDADTLPEDWAKANASDYLSDVLDINYIVDSERRYRSARVWITLGGPNAYIDTEERALVVNWGGDTGRWNLPIAFCEGIDDYLGEYFAD